MKIVALLMVTALSIGSPALCQTSKRGFPDKGCPEADLFADAVTVSADDYIEVQKIRCFIKCPLYTVRVYGDGRVAWHGDQAVASIGDAATRVSAEQARTLISTARQLGFGSLCDEYAMRAFDGPISSTSLRIGNQLKIVANEAPSNAPSWLYDLDKRVADLDAVRNLIGPQSIHR